MSQKELPPHAWPAAAAAAVLSIAISACGASLAQLAERRAVGDFGCRPPALRVSEMGELRVGRQPGLRVELYEASGCEREQVYLCVDEPSARCESAISALPAHADHRALERALHLLRTVSRARCPGSELRVSQESESLYRYEACDGRWLYHCRRERCDRL